MNERPDTSIHSTAQRTNTMNITITTGNIVHSATNAIVNPANESLSRGGGTCGAIFDAVEKAGGVARLKADCQKIGHCPTGSAVTTSSHGLAAQYIIHAVGPVWHGRDVISTNNITSGERHELLLLKSTYQAILAECHTYGIGSVTIPAISTGIFKLPKDLGAAIALAVCEAQTQIAVTLIAFNGLNRNILAAASTSTATAVLSQAGII
jgi:O-acetyl-ADP-ribose deacetylase (regulator of RNase III)